MYKIINDLCGFCGIHTFGNLYPIKKMDGIVYYCPECYEKELIKKELEEKQRLAEIKMRKYHEKVNDEWIADCEQSKKEINCLSCGGYIHNSSLRVKTLRLNKKILEKEYYGVKSGILCCKCFKIFNMDR